MNGKTDRHDNRSLVIDVGRLLARARAVAVLTGAGISAESGVPTFRGPDGLWRNFRAEELATPEAFARDPALVWEWYRWRRRWMATVVPNPGHLALVSLESRFPAFTLITQNVDGLHVCAGSRHVLEIHGNIWRDRCSRNPAHLFQRQPSDAAGSSEAAPLPRCHCGALLRPDVVWFCEGLNPAHLDAAVEAVSSADILLVVGTSSVVYPAAALPAVARQAGADVVEINPEETPQSPEMDLVLRGPAGVLLPELDRLIRQG